MRMFRCINLQSSPSYYAVWCMMMNGNQQSKTPAIRSTHLIIHCERFDLDKMSIAVSVVIVGQITWQQSVGLAIDRSICAAVSVNRNHCYHHYPISREKQTIKNDNRLKHSIVRASLAGLFVCSFCVFWLVYKRWTGKKTVQKYATCCTRSMKILTPIHISTENVHFSTSKFCNNNTKHQKICQKKDKPSEREDKKAKI